MGSHALCYNCFAELEDEQKNCPHCGYEPVSNKERYPAALEHGSVLGGQYIVGRVLGQGGFGITYLALDHHLKIKVAIKEFLPEGMATRLPDTTLVSVYSGEKEENFRYGAERFLDEARVLAKFIGHPNIAAVKSYFDENNTSYFVMDYIEGISFKNYIANKGGKIDWQDALRVLTPVLQALSAVHTEGIIHRDVTPDNIYITRNDEIKLLDFGSARYSLGDKSKSLDVILKAGYAPKEQYVRRGKQGPYTDVYSVAACFYAAITGYLPPESLERMEDDNLVEISTRGIKIPAALEDAIMKGLEVRAEDRFQTAAEFLAAIETDGRGTGGTGGGTGGTGGGAGGTGGGTGGTGGGIGGTGGGTGGTDDGSGKPFVLPFSKKTMGIAASAVAACLILVAALSLGGNKTPGGNATNYSPNSNGSQIEQAINDANAQAEADRIAAEKAEADRIAAEQAEADRLAAEQAEADRLAAEKAEADRLAAEQAEADRLAAEKAEADRLAAEKAEADRLAAEKAEADRIAAEKAEAERKAAEEAEKAANATTKVTNQRYTYSDPYMSGASGSYTGDWKDGKPNGQGTFVFDSKYSSMGYPSKYVGSWVNGNKHGYGVATWSNGNKYEGNFNNNKKSGWGKMTYSDGTVWEGNWSNDAPDK